MLANFRGILADPRAKVCFTSVFFEAIFVHGLFPFVALLLIAVGQPNAIVAGLLIGCFAFGGVAYSLSVPYLMARIPEPRLMILGGAISACALAMIALQFSWVVQIGLFTMFGVGFYLLHSCIQVHVTDLSQTARGAATSMHSTCFFMGQAIGPVVYGYGFAHGGMEATMFVGSAVLLTIGIVCSRLLRHRGASI
jgi:predicted MFS family arabinose efflux permease